MSMNTLIRFCVVTMFVLTSLTAAAQTVEIPDPNLRAAIEEALGKNPGEAIYSGEMASLTELSAARSEISDLRGLEHAINLTYVELQQNSISDFSVLTGLTNLTYLDLFGNSISDISALSGLTNLTYLGLAGNLISDFSVLAGLTNLTSLDLSFNPKFNISVVAGLTDLTRLYLYANAISDISVLTGLTNLTFLDLGNNSISDFSPLAGLTNLTTLAIGGNAISDLSVLASLTNLTRLSLWETNVSDISVLSGLTNLTSLDISRAPLNYQSINTYIPSLQEKGVEVEFDSRTPTSLVTISGDNQNGIPGQPLSEPFVVEVRDEYGAPFEGVPVAFAVTSGGGTLSVEMTTTDAHGRAQSTLTYSADEGPQSVSVSVTEIAAPVTFTVREMGQPVEIPDLNLRAAIEEALGKNPGEAIYSGEMASLTELSAARSEISDLRGLEHAINLTSLALWGNSISDISVLAGLTNLTDLNLGQNSISDISALAGLTNLTAVDLGSNTLSDISALAGLTKLRFLDLYFNSISDIPAVANLNELEYLSFQGNSVSNLSPLAGLINLTSLILSENSVSDLSPLVANTGLGGGDLVYVGRNPLSSVSIKTHIPALRSRGVEVSAENLITAVPSQAVDIPDSNLRAAIEEALGKNPGVPINVDEMASLTQLVAEETEISDLRGLEHATNLMFLVLLFNQISDISALAGLTNLTDLGLVGNSISDISVLGGLTNLTSLTLVEDSISDISVLAGLTNLTSLTLVGNSISDISVLGGLTNLTSLTLGGNSISDISVLAGLTNLTFLDLHHNSISDLSVLASLTSLTTLNLWEINVSDISVLGGLTNLTSLTLAGNSISDLTVLAGLTNLTHLGLWGTSVSDISVLAGLTKLTELYLYDNSISDISALAGLANLTGLYLHGNLLNYQSINTYIPSLQERGVAVEFDSRTPTSLVKIAGDNQHGIPGHPLPEPFVVEVRDQYFAMDDETVTDDGILPDDAGWADDGVVPSPFAGVPVEFAVISGGGTLSVEKTTTDAHGRAQSTLTYGNDAGPQSVTASVAEIADPVIFVVRELGQPVEIPDLNLRTAIEFLLGKSPGEPIYSGEMTSLDVVSSEVTADDSGIRDLSGLEHAINLTVLYLDGIHVSDLSVLAGLTNLTKIHLGEASVSDISALAGLTNLTSLNINAFSVSDLSALSGLTNLENLTIYGTAVSDISALAGLTNLNFLDLSFSQISDISVLSGLTNLTQLGLSGNPLNYQSINTYIPSLQERGVTVEFDSRTPTSLVKISGDNQHGIPGQPLPEPFVVEVRDQYFAMDDGTLTDYETVTDNGILPDDAGWTDDETVTDDGILPDDAGWADDGVVPSPFAGVPVEFAVISGGGTLSVEKTTTDAHGRAQSTLTYGNDAGPQSVTASVAEIADPVTFTVREVPQTEIPDPNLRAAIEEALGKSPGEPINVDEMASLTELQAVDDDISDLRGLEHAINLTSLHLGANSISDISVLGGLTNLTSLGLTFNSISDLSVLAGLTNLTWLNIRGNSISDLSALAGLTNLTWLSLEENPISDLSVLAGLTNLTSLGIGGNSISDISAFSGLTNLTHLGLWGTSVSDLSVLSGLTNLTNLYLWSTNASDLSFLAGLTNLTELELGGNPVSDISVLAGLTNLTYLNLSNHSISDISVLEGLTNLTSLKINAFWVSNISALSGLTNLTHLGLWGTSVSDISVLAGLTNLTDLGLHGNPLNYQSINTYIPSLQERGVEVRFDSRTPTTLVKISGDNQDGILGQPLPEPFVVEVQDQEGLPFEGVPVAFVVASGGGTLSLENATTDAHGRAETMLTLGSSGDSGSVSVSVGDITETINFTSMPVGRFDLSAPRGLSLIHVPLKVKSVNGAEARIDTLSDLYDALGGGANVKLLITYHTARGQWISYIGEQDRGKVNNRTLTDGLGIVASLRNAVTLELQGDALGADGISTITLNPGMNLVGLPLRDSRIVRVSDLLALDGIRGNVSEVTVSENGKFSVVGRAGDKSDIPVTGGQSFILMAATASTVTISGEAWDNVSEVAAAPPLPMAVTEARDVTPALALTGGVVDEATGMPREGFHVVVRNLATGAALSTESAADSDGTSGYRLTFVDINTGRAARIGDILEISAKSPDPRFGVQPLRHVVTNEDLENGIIRVENLLAYEIPAETELLSNYPNPFNPETWIPYRLAEDGDVTLTLYNAAGAVVRRLDVGHKSAAVYESKSKAIYWDGRNEFGEQAASGVYFYELATPSFRQIRRMVILK